MVVLPPPTSGSPATATSWNTIRPTRARSTRRSRPRRWPRSTGATPSIRSATARICARACARSISTRSRFDTGSFTVTPDQAARLSVIAAAINKAIRANPQEVFLIEGYTDAVGSDIDNLSLSDRRAQSVATVLTQQFQVPPENPTTQGYGEQYLKVNTQGPSRENRRVTVRRITPLLQQGQAQAAPPR
ncbi:OmpA family protein [Methylobacterium oryzae CBMB20]